MRLPTSEQQDGIRQLLARVTAHGIALTPAEEAAWEWLDNEVLQAIDEGRCAEWEVDPGDGCGKCPFEIHGSNCCGLAWRLTREILPCSSPAPEQCRLTRGTMVLVRARP